MFRFKKLLMALTACLILMSCVTELYSGLTEREANAILGALLERGISAEKVGADNLFTISVANDDVADALAILDSLGLPQNIRTSMGEVFAGSGIVSSPFEERVRYIYALSEEVAQTLMEIDGVLVARVHIVMPEEPELGQDPRPSSAAVFIKQRLGFDLDFLMPQIRRMVANSIEGMQYEAVTVVLVEAQGDQIPIRDVAAELSEPLPGLVVASNSLGMIWSILGVAVSLAIILAGAVGYLFFKLSRLRSQMPDSEEADA